MEDKKIKQSISSNKSKASLPDIPDMFLIDDLGKRQEFRDSISSDPVLEFDKVYFQTHNTFFNDMNLDQLFKKYLKIEELENPNNHSIQDLFFFLPKRTDIVKFRQDILSDFIQKQDLSYIIEDAINTLNKDLSMVSFSASKKGLLLPYSRLLKNYEDILTGLIKTLNSAKSEGLLQISGFLKQMKDHSYMEIWKEYDRRIEDEVPFFLSLTRRYDFTPISFSIFGFEKESAELSEKLKQNTDRFGKISSNDIKGSRLETFELALSSRNHHIRIPLVDAIVQIMMQVFGNPFQGLEDHVRYTIAALNQLNYYRNAAALYFRLTSRGITCVFPKIQDMDYRQMKAIEVNNFLIEVEPGKELVSNDVECNDKKRINIITGSNYGGKSWYMKTIGLVQLMGQVGLFVPAKEAVISLVDHIYTHFPEKEGAGDIESRYSWELERAKRIFTYATPYSLVLFDEPCSGTAYKEGLLQTVTFIKVSSQISMTTFFTTHMHEIAEDIENNKDIYTDCENLFVETEVTDQGPRYTYNVKQGRAIYSNAEKLAEAKGCDEIALKKLLEGRVLTNSLPQIEKKMC
ncbi:MAG: hypothetical protein SVR08_03635 [Spirochaetota bacterium]|nr:hypothetical protein [Spirochaetota bacterium]